jgi:diguanylate cyclase (GGDEF)-like protein
MIPLMSRFLPQPRRAQAGSNEIRRTRRLVLVSIVALLAAIAILVTTVHNVAGWIDARAGQAEAQAAIAAIALLAEAGEASLDRVAGLAEALSLDDWRIAGSPSDGHKRLSVQVAAAGGSTAYLTWATPGLGTAAFLTFAPTRVPFIVGAILAVIALIVRVASLARTLEAERMNARAGARTDTLTGLGNRLAFDEARETMEADGRDFHLVMIDLDGFKAVNDSLGHAAGDAVLAAVGARLASIAGPRHRVYRLGGDEFALLLDHGMTRRDMTGLIANIQKTAAQPVRIDGGLTARFGASLGLASFDRVGRDQHRLFSAADQALYAAKTNADAALRFCDTMRTDEEALGRRVA